MKRYKMFLQNASSAASSFSFLYGEAKLFGLSGGLMNPKLHGRDIRYLSDHLRRDIGLID